MIEFIDDTNLVPEDSYYTSAKVTLEHLEENEKAEIKSTEPIQVRINGGPWIDVRSLEQA
jgi:hypothetical protein